MRRGAQDLLNNHHHQKSSIAEAYVKGDIADRDKCFVMEVIDESHIEAAKKEIDREHWHPQFRLAELEKEVAVLKGLRQRGRTRLLPEVVKDRRVGLVPYKIRVHNDDPDRPHWQDYKVLATRSLDARILAFALDGGYNQAMDELDDFNVELAITWTEVL